MGKKYSPRLGYLSLAQDFITYLFFFFYMRKVISRAKSQKPYLKNCMQKYCQVCNTSFAACAAKNNSDRTLVKVAFLSERNSRQWCHTPGERVLWQAESGEKCVKNKY